MFDKKIFGNNLKQLRTSQQLTLEQLGEIFNVTKQTVSRWETGTRLPTIEVIYDIADYFNISIDSLVGHKTNK